MSSPSLRTKYSHLARRLAVSALMAVTLACGVVVGEGAAFARGRVGPSRARVGIGVVGRPMVPHRYAAPGYWGWQAGRGRTWVAPGWGYAGPGWGWSGARWGHPWAGGHGGFARGGGHHR